MEKECIEWSYKESSGCVKPELIADVMASFMAYLIVIFLIIWATKEFVELIGAWIYYKFIKKDK